MIDIKACSSYQELRNNATENDFEIYGDLDDYNNKFEIITITEYAFTCGLMYYDHGISPQILLLNDEPKLFVGFEKWIIGIDCISKAEIYKHKAISLFYEFIETESCILAICELDIFALSLECKLIWSSGFRDIVESYKVLNGKTISIMCSNGDKSEFELKTGKSL